MRKGIFTWKLMQLCLAGCLCFLCSLSAMAQSSSTISGRVVDEATRLEMIGVAVVEQGTQNGTTTDVNGAYTLNVKQGATIIFSYIGYKTIELPASTASGEIRMVEDSQTLENVVVVGYGTQKKVNLSGAVSAVSGEDIASKPASDALTALQGTMPGVQILRSSGEPGSESSGIRVRGFSSANSTSTLVLIDGIEGDMSLLNPNDIESVSVLKDAAAAAIYGARAAAGVVLVTTKSGKEGRAQVSYNGYYGINTPGNMPERLPAWEEQEFINESRRQQQNKPEWSPEQSSWVANPNFNYRPNNTNGRWDLFHATNYIEEGTRKVMTQQNHSLSVSGGTEKVNYLASAGYYSKQGILKYGPDENERYNFRLKVNAELAKNVTMGALVTYQGKFMKQNPYGSKNILERMYRVRGRQPIFQPEEDINENPYNGDLQVNPIDLMINGGVNKNNYQAYTGKVDLHIKEIVPGLALDLSASRKAANYSRTTTKRHLVWYDRLGTTVRFQANNPNEMSRQKNNDYHDQFEAILRYNRTFGRHTIGALAGMSYEQYKKDEMTGTVKNLSSNDFFSFNYYDKSVADNSILSDKIETWALMSYFGRINYNFDDRYLLEANLRYDGSSRLAPDNRWELFPSFSAAWRINQEEWFDVRPISNLKLRASWGQLGNGAILGLYDYIALINSGTDQGNVNYYQSDMASTGKTWEIISTTNVGLDLGMFGSKLNVTADYYWKKNDNMLSALELPSLVGIGVPDSNVGTLKTWGWEFEVSYRNSYKDFRYEVAFNLSDSQNKVVRYDGKNRIAEGAVGILEGYPMNTIWGYRTDGFWSSRDEYLAYKEANPGYKSFNDGYVSGGDLKYLAQGKADHQIGEGGGTPENPGDLVCLGNSNGRYLYGLTLNLAWKGIDFSMMFQGVGKRDVMINKDTLTPFAATANMPWTIHRDYWTPENTDATWPRLFSGNNFNYHIADRYIQDGSYIRLKNIQLGYTIPLKKVQKLRVYVSGQDVWEHSKMLEVYDPEVGNNAGASVYPFFRTWIVGLNITL